jgi:MFS superfamily sulfate permease-like transporter
MTESAAPHHAAADGDIPRGTLANLTKYLKFDLLSGFLVFLIALPLCLAISIASGYQPMAGVFTAIIGGVVGAFLSNSELTIKGPAAGLIVIAIGCVTQFQQELGISQFEAYRMALAVGVVAAGVQVFFALLRSGALGEFFPTSAVHGMLASIGVIIMAKQIPVAVGYAEKLPQEPLELIRELPHIVMSFNPEIALIGAISLLILFGKPLLKNKYVAMVPSQLLVLIVAIPLGMYFGLDHTHTYTFQQHRYEVGEQHLVDVKPEMFAIVKDFATPNFDALQHGFAWYWVMMYSLIGSLESLLSTKAVDLLDPWKRKTNLNRDLLAVGVGNLASSFVGGLPMISEIVRSRANIDNGARTRFANLFHSVFLLLCVAFLPMVIHRIPLAALAAMLIYTGFRLAHPREFVHVFKIGPEQLLIYVATIIGVLATDLLWGVLIGIGVKVAVHLVNGLPVRSIFKPYLEVVEDDADTYRIIASYSAVFSNWIPFRRQLVNAGMVQHKNVVLDMSECRLVDHTVMEKLHELEKDFAQEGLTFRIEGLENHRPLSKHPHAARKCKARGAVAASPPTPVA